MSLVKFFLNKTKNIQENINKSKDKKHTKKSGKSRKKAQKNYILRPVKKQYFEPDLKEKKPTNHCAISQEHAHQRSVKKQSHLFVDCSEKTKKNLEKGPKQR